LRLAAIYDIHGNLPALEAVIEEVAQSQADVIVVGGDAVWGPMPRETLMKLQEVKLPMHFIRGNADRVLAELMSGQDISMEVPEKTRQVAAWVAQQLEPGDEDLLFSWHRTVKLAANGLGEVLFCHATPQDDTTIFTRLTPEVRLRPLFENVGANLVVCGHTHMQTDRLIGEVRVVTAGSVGKHHGDRGAYWLLLDADVEFKCTLYDFEDAARRVRETAFPEAEEFAAGSIMRPQSEAETLEIFEPVSLGGSYTES
jgi:putative phosphoesterase